MQPTSLKTLFQGKVVIIGIGNILRSDDGFGPALISGLKDKIKAVCINAGTAPENYTGKIIQANPDTILIVDAVDLDKKPGEFEILKKDDIIKSGFSTHDISPNMFIEYLEHQTQADIYMLGLQPENLSFGEEMSDNIKAALKKISTLIQDHPCMRRI